MNPALQLSPLEESILNREIINNDFTLSKDALQEDIKFIKYKIAEDYSQETSNAAPANSISTCNKITLETVSLTLYKLVINEHDTSSSEIHSNALWCIENAQNALNEENTIIAQESAAYAFQFLATSKLEKLPPTEVNTDPFLRKFAEVIFIFNYTTWSLFKDRCTSDEYFEIYTETLELHRDSTDSQLSDMVNIKSIHAITGKTFQLDEGTACIAYSLIDACAALRKKSYEQAARDICKARNFLIQTFFEPFFDGSPQAKGKRGAQGRKTTLDKIKNDLKVKVLSIMQAPGHVLNWKSKEIAIEFLATQLSAHQNLKDQEKLHGQISQLFKSDVEVNTRYKYLNEKQKKTSNSK